MSPYIRKVRTASGATAVQIAQKVAGRHRILDHVGSAHTEAEVAALVAVAHDRMYPGQQEFDLFPAEVNRSGTIETKSSRWLWETLEAAYQQLGFDAVGDGVFEHLVLARVIEPASKAETVRILESLGVPSPSLRTIFRTLARINERDYRGILAKACYEHALARGSVALCLYDVTTLYFEAEKEDELRKVGYSKERRVDPQIVVGLLVDRTGFPLQVHCFEGNKPETHTLIPVLDAFTALHGLEDLVVVADAGMLSAANLEALEEAGYRFIVGSRIAKAPYDLAAHFERHGTFFTHGQILEATTPMGAERKPRRVVYQYSQKRFVRDNRTITQQENRAKAILAGDTRPKNARFLKTSGTTRKLDETAIARAQDLAGLKGYITNIPATVMDGNAVIAAYHELWQVERSFRMAKTDLAARPIFHRLRDSIEAHLTIVFAALAISRHLQDTTGYSVKKIVRTLRPLQHQIVTIAGHQHHVHDPLTPDAAHILKSLEIEGH